MNIAAAWSGLDFKVAFFIFIAYILLDALYAYYTLVVIKRKPLTASNTSAVIHFISAVGVLNYVQNYLYIIPLMIGSWIGTYIVVKKHTHSFHIGHLKKH